MKRLTTIAALSSLILLLGASHLQAQLLPPRPRFVLQAGGNLTLPTGEFASTDGGLATTSIGFQARGCFSISRKLAIFAGIVNPRFGYDKIMIEDTWGREVGDTTQRFSILNVGLRFTFSDDRENAPYMQASYGRYAFEDDPAVEGLPMEADNGTNPGFSVGMGIMNSHIGLGLDITFEYHKTSVRYLDGYKMNVQWLSASIAVGIPFGEVR